MDLGGACQGHKIRDKISPDMVLISPIPTTYKGDNWHTLLVRGTDSDTPTYDLYVPGVENKISLVPSDGASQLTTPAAIVQEYTDQQKGK
jgi:hypothetical protein